MVVLDPVKVIITNYPEGKTEKLQAENNPEDPESGYRELVFGRELYIEREDFIENAPPKYFRMTPGANVRLKMRIYFIVQECKKDNDGNIFEITATYYPDSKSGEDVSG
jgi:glutaminyl-tRNA synthetase